MGRPFYCPLLQASRPPPCATILYIHLILKAGVFDGREIRGDRHRERVRRRVSACRLSKRWPDKVMVLERGSGIPWARSPGAARLRAELLEHLRVPESSGPAEGDAELRGPRPVRHPQLRAHGRRALRRPRRRLADLRQRLHGAPRAGVRRALAGDHQEGGARTLLQHRQGGAGLAADPAQRRSPPGDHPHPPLRAGGEGHRA